jgi:hypothetical protein
VSTEGVNTERIYINDLASPKHFYNTRITVEVLQREEAGESSPEHVIEKLNEFHKKFKLESTDELWLVIDVDR